jgi:hypothetical protein
VTPR